MKSFTTRITINEINFSGPTIHAESREDASAQAAAMDVWGTVVVEGEGE